MKRTLEHVLVATDFSDASMAAIDYAAILAQGLGARLHLVHVLEQPFVSPRARTNGQLPDTPARREQRYNQALSEAARDAEAVGHLVTASAEVRGGSVTRGWRRRRSITAPI